MTKNLIPLVLAGSGGHAKIVIDIIELVGVHKIIGITTQDSKLDSFQGYPVLGSDAELPKLFKQGIRYAAVGVGGYRDNERRKIVFSHIKGLGFNVISAVHPSAIIARDVQIGEGSVVCAGVVLNPGVSIGENVIVVTGSLVDHESIVDNHVLIAGGVSVGANVHIQEEALLAIGSTVVSGKVVGKNSLVAAGAVVVKDVDAGGTVMGIPARIV